MSKRRFNLASFCQFSDQGFEGLDELVGSATVVAHERGAHAIVTMLAGAGNECLSRDPKGEFRSDRFTQMRAACIRSVLDPLQSDLNQAQAFPKISGPGVGCGIQRHGARMIAHAAD
jgi:hypothetical protein